MANEPAPPSGSSPQGAAYSPGLAGVVAGESAICSVDPAAGLLYRGYDVHELATQASFEEVVWLLIHGELPTADQLEQARETLAAERALPDEVLKLCRLMPAGGEPIDLLRTGVSLLGCLDAEENDNSPAANGRKAMRLIARLSTLTTSGWRLRRGQEPFTPGAHLTYAARFLYSLTGREPRAWEAVAFNTVLVLYAEHEFNASTFAARVTASTLSDLYSAVVSALGTLKGPLHGGANEGAMRMLAEIGTADRAEAWVRERLARKEKVMGFGHRVYKAGDSRVPAMRALARQLCQRSGEASGQGEMCDVCEKLEEVMAREKKLYANLDLYAAPVLHLLEIPKELDVPVFACARVAGWCAHVIEQHDHNRLIRPRCLYSGPPRRPYRPPGATA